jgi:hypothetical protein
MRQRHSAQLACERCFNPMNWIELVPVLQSVEEYVVFECHWCQHVTLVRTHREPQTATWAGALGCESQVSFAAR